MRISTTIVAFLICLIAGCNRGGTPLSYTYVKADSSEKEAIVAERILRAIDGVHDVRSSYTGLGEKKNWYQIDFTCDPERDLEVRERLLGLGYHRAGFPPEPPTANTGKAPEAGRSP